MLELRASSGSGEEMSRIRANPEAAGNEAPLEVIETLPLWQLDIAELTGHNLEARGREEVNRLLESGWRLLHIYTLKYQEDGVWRERPMAILGRLRK
jgi:FtsZ-binding cell division protein ZapB